MNNISVNKQVKPLVERLVENHEKLNLVISESDGGAKIIDAGIKAKGLPRSRQAYYRDLYGRLRFCKLINDE